MLIIPGQRKAFENLFTCLLSLTICKKNLRAGPISLCSRGRIGWLLGAWGKKWEFVGKCMRFRLVCQWPQTSCLGTYGRLSTECHRIHFCGLCGHPALGMGISKSSFGCPEEGYTHDWHQRRMHLIAANINIIKLNIVFRNLCFGFM